MFTSCRLRRARPALVLRSSQLGGAGGEGGEGGGGGGGLGEGGVGGGLQSNPFHGILQTDARAVAQLSAAHPYTLSVAVLE